MSIIVEYPLIILTYFRNALYAFMFIFSLAPVDEP